MNNDISADINCRSRYTINVSGSAIYFIKFRKYSCTKVMKVKKYKQNQERIAYYQRRITGLNIEKYETECDSAKVEAELAEYYEKFKVVCDVLISLSMSEKQAFTKEPENDLVSKIATLNDEPLQELEHAFYRTEQLSFL